MNDDAQKDETQKDQSQKSDQAEPTKAAAEKAAESEKVSASSQGKPADESGASVKQSDTSTDEKEKSIDKQKGKSSDSEEKSAKPAVKLNKKQQDIIAAIEQLSVLELADLVKALEDTFGVTAAPPMAVGAAPTAGGNGADEGPKEEQTVFNVVLAEAGGQKIQVIKAVRELVPTLGLTDAKALVESAPKPVLEAVNKEAAEEAKKKLEAAGAKVELK